MTSGQGIVIGGHRAGRSRVAHPLAWGVLGVIAQAAFMAGWLVAETWQGPRYGPVTNTISDMQAATAPQAWFPISCFAVGGLGTFCFAVFGLRPALAGAGKVAAHAPWMLACSALALGNSFPLIPCRLADPGCTVHHQLYSPGGLTDAIVASLAFLVLAFTPSPLWQRLKVVPQWRRLKPVMLAARVICPLCFILLSVSSLTGTAEGLMERILTASCVLWISALAITLIVVSRHPAKTQE
ncbi:MAG: DUF998 domain-containing protein [Streptosporangiaceae bacterium]